MEDQRAKGLLLSYVNAALNMLTSFLLTPLLISAFSDETYSLYKVMQSFAGSLMMFNLGLSTVVGRAAARHESLKTPESLQEKDSTFALALAVSLMMCAVVMLLGFAMTKILPFLFGDTFSPALLETAKPLILIFAASTAVHILCNTLQGCAQGRGRFVFLQLSNSGHHLFRFFLMLALIRQHRSIAGMAMADLCAYLLMLAGYVLYCHFSLKVRLRPGPVSGETARKIATFSAAMLLQAIITQVNTNLDLIILGAAADARVITMYSSALTIYGAYNSVVLMTSGLYFPSAAQLTAKEASPEALTDFTITPARIQAICALGIWGGFALLGGDFVRLWIGAEYTAAHPLALVLMLVSTIPLLQNACLTILDAKLQRMVRSLILIVVAAVNALLSLLLIKPLGYWGTALGTVISMLLGHVVLMNLYYVKSFHLDVRRMFRETLSGTLPAALLTCLVCLPLSLTPTGSAAMLVVKCGAFLVIYAGALWKFGLHPEEKEYLTALTEGIFHGA